MSELKETSVGTEASSARHLIERITSKHARVGVIGLGYVGLPLAVEFAEAGLTVTPVDLDVTQLGLHPVVTTKPEGDEREDEADPGNRPADELGRRAEVEDAGEPAGERRRRKADAQQHEKDRDPRQRPPGWLRWKLELDRDLDVVEVFAIAPEALADADTPDELPGQRGREPDDVPGESQ